MLNMFYVLKDQQPIACKSAQDFSEQYFLSNPFLKIDKTDRHTVSTIFLGIDLRRKDELRPVLFETLVTTDSLENKIELDRYSTWEEAMSGHELLLDKYANLHDLAN
ncbi:MAG: hypothetical protein AAGI23_03275 [Bacteroidota bacterium]